MNENNICFLKLSNVMKCVFGNRIILTIIALFLCFLSTNCQVVNNEEYPEALFSNEKIATIEINMPDSTWKSIIDNASEKAYHECSLTINGEHFERVGIRTKGASSLDDVQLMKSDRFSFTLKLNKYVKGQNYHGMTKLLLNNNIWDATQMKDAIVYDMCRFIGLPAPLTNHAKIMLNGGFFGCYLLVEPVDKHFCQRNFPNVKSNIYKPYHNLAYKGDSLEAYADILNYAKVKGGETSMRSIIAALKSVDFCEGIEDHVDIESLAKYMALQTFVVNFDSMTGYNAQNYYLREANGVISLLPWDYNMAWGGYPDDGEEFGDFDQDEWEQWFNSLSQEQQDSIQKAFSQESSLQDTKNRVSTYEEVSKIVNFPIETPFLGDITKRRFFMNLLANKDFKSLYYHYLSVLCLQYIQGGAFRTTVATIKNEIGTIAGTEANAFYTNEEFHKAVQTLDMVLQRRAESVLGQINGSIPSNWDAQKTEPNKLINCDGINLTDMGGI